MPKFAYYLLTFLTLPERKDDRGATAVEYGLLVALIAAVIITIVATLGTQIAAAFTTVSGKFPAPAN